MKNLILFATLLLLIGCGEPVTEKHQQTRDKIVDISDKIVKVDPGKELLLGVGSLIVVNDYVLMQDYRSQKELLHILDRKTLKHTWSGLRKGRGRGEVMSLSRISADPERGRFFSSVNTNIASFNIDSMMNVRDYKPLTYAMLRFNDDNLIRSSGNIEYVNDTLSFSTIISIPPGTGISVRDNIIEIKGGAMQVYPMNTTEGGINFVERSYPDGVEPFFYGAGSLEHNIIVEGHQSEDLLSLHDLDGNLICNVLGPDWNSTEDRFGFSNVTIVKERIFATYSGTPLKSDEEKVERVLIFNLKGDYIKSIDFGIKVYSYAYDEKGDRLLLFIEDEDTPIAYLDMRWIL